MSKKFKYTLDLSSKKFICPDCNKKTFVRYKNQEGDYHEDPRFGRCDRENNCGCMNIPKDDPQEKTMEDFAPKKRIPENPASFIPFEHMESSWNNYKYNPFTLFLVKLFGDAKTVELIKKYRWGVDNTSIYTRLYTIFWQIDSNEKVRSGKMIEYGEDGRRKKESLTTWFHRKKDGNNNLFPDFNLKQCLYGEHLLKLEPTKPVAIVESEKTAIIASVFIPKYLWLACGGLTQLDQSKAKALKNRSVTLFPDLGSVGKNGDQYIDSQTNIVWTKENEVWIKTDKKKDKWPQGSDKHKFRSGNGEPASAYSIWSGYAKKYNWNISNHLEKVATEEQRKQGLDIADFLI
jgi:hypothetical protein